MLCRFQGPTIKNWLPFRSLGTFTLDQTWCEMCSPLAGKRPERLREGLLGKVDAHQLQPARADALVWGERCLYIAAQQGHMKGQ
jgi:hypothetical protein